MAHRIWGNKLWFSPFMGIIFFFMFQTAFAQSFDLGSITPVSLHESKSAWRLLDGRPKAMWEKEHIPQSRSFSWEDYTGIDEKKIPYRVFSPEKIARALAEMGITENTPIVAYGDADQSWGGEAWICWVLTWLGHKGPVRLLSGGIDAWTAADYPLASSCIVKSENTPPCVYQLDVRKNLNVTSDFIAHLPENHVIVDTRSLREWIMGDRLPGAVHIHWENFFTGPHRSPIDAAALKELLRDNGVSEEQTVVYYCTGGIRSAFAWLVHELYLNGKALNYEGGTEAWKREKN